MVRPQASALTRIAETFSKKESIIRSDAVKALLNASFANGKRISFHLSSFSMLPTLQPGDILSVERVAADKISPGDIVVLDSGEEWLAHRILRTLPNRDGFDLLTKGDNRTSIDPLWEHLKEVPLIIEIKRGDCISITTSNRNRLGGRLIACLSYLQAVACSFQNRWIQRIGYKITSSLIALFSTLIYRFV